MPKYNNTYKLTGQVEDRQEIIKSINTIKADMAMSYHFKVELLTNKSNSTSSVSNFSSNQESSSNFLPVQNITFSVASLNTSSTKIGLINGFPLPEGVNLPSITLTMADTTTDNVERIIKAWYNRCVPQNKGYVGYLEDMLGTLKYKSYKHDGSVNFTCTLPVMLSGDLQYTRDYSTSDLKTMSLDLIILAETAQTDS